jgi:uncharacterized protein GlcG (DUF336 family)
MCIAVVDGDGTLKAFTRMDGAPLLAVQLWHGDTRLVRVREE